MEEKSNRESGEYFVAEKEREFHVDFVRNREEERDNLRKI